MAPVKIQLQYFYHYSYYWSVAVFLRLNEVTNNQ